MWNRRLLVGAVLVAGALAAAILTRRCVGIGDQIATETMVGAILASPSRFIGFSTVSNGSNGAYDDGARGRTEDRIQVLADGDRALVCIFNASGLHSIYCIDKRKRVSRWIVVDGAAMRQLADEVLRGPSR
jgi:hypothetical protein